MKKMFTKVLAVVLCAVMALGAAPLGGFVGLDLPGLFDLKAEAATYSGTCGDDLTWSLNTSTGVLNITGTGAMKNYSNLEYVPWYSYSSYIKSVNIGNSVTTIGDWSFGYCDGLTNVTLSKSVTIIGDYAFIYCDSLTSVTIPDSVTTIGYAAFGDCDSLTRVTISESVTSIDEDAFPYCDSLTSITVDVNNKNYSSDSYGVLFNKDKTTLVQYPIGNTRTSYSIPDGVTTIGYGAFDSCDSLTSVTIPNSVTTIGDSAFYECKNLTNVTIPNSVKNIGKWSFSYCENLTSVSIPNSVITIGEVAFYGCDSLKNITIPDSVKTIGESALGWCDSLTNITVSANNKYYSSDSDGILFNKDKTTLCQYPNGKAIKSYIISDGVTAIGNGAFCNCENLTSVTIPDSVRTIGDEAFYSCDSLEDVYYDGVEEQWNKITIGFSNEWLTNANIHYKDISDEAVVPTPSQTTIKYGDSIILHVDPAKVPEGGYVEWVASNNNFVLNVSKDGTTCTIKPSVSGSTTFTATVYDKDGKPVSIDEQVMTSKAGFFDKLIAFFKSIFGLSKVYEY